mgnify:CR=1 FL=1
MTPLESMRSALTDIERALVLTRKAQPLPRKSLQDAIRSAQKTLRAHLESPQT